MVSVSKIEDESIEETKGGSSARDVVMLWVGSD
jgi:hypothetical protein